MNHLNKFKRKKSAYSLLEVTVSLGIMGIVMTMLFSILILSLQITFKILARSVVREELANISSQISRDIRNADKLTICGGADSLESCGFVSNGVEYRWTRCGDRMCKNEIASDGSSNTIYTSSASVKLEEINFDIGFSDSSDLTKQNILITIVGSHTNQNFNVNNVIRQTSASTRNYEL